MRVYIQIGESYSWVEIRDELVATDAGYQLGCLSSLHLRGELGYERIQLVTILLRLG